VAPAFHHGRPFVHVAGTDALKLIAELTPAESGNDEMLLRRSLPSCWPGCNRRCRKPRPPAAHSTAN
jgi:hypothetical protein